MKLIKPALVVVVACALGLSACTKAEDLEVDNESQSAIDYTLAHQEFATVPAMIYKMLMRTRGATQSLYPINASGMKWVAGDTVKYETAPVFTCGSAEMLSAMGDGNTRSGTINVRISYPVNIPGTIVTATLSNYVVNGITYEAAVISMTTVGESSNYIGVQYAVTAGTCSNAKAQFSYTGNHRLAIYYAGGPQYSTAYYTVYGSATGVSRGGLKYTAEVIKDQMKADACSCMIAGTTELRPDGFKTKTLNFGDGQCDEIGTMTIAENTISFKLK